MRKKSPKRGKNTSPKGSVEVLNISSRGVWLLANDTEYFMPHDDFPWFREARVREIVNVELKHGHHLYWPDLDVDLHTDSLANLQHYPLVTAL